MAKIYNTMKNTLTNHLHHGAAILAPFKGIVVALCLLFGASVAFATGDANLTIQASTGNGAWSFSAGTYTFTPTANTSTVNVADIQNCLLGSGSLGGTGITTNAATTNGKGNVTILTASSGSSNQAGNVTFSNGITVAANSATQLTFQVIAAGTITLNQTVAVGGTTGGTPGFPGINVILQGGGTVQHSGGGGLTTTGGASSGTGNGGNAGSFTMISTGGNVSAGISSTATGGAGNGTGNGGNGGTLTLTAAAGTVTYSNPFNNSGGAGGTSSGNGGNGGSNIFSCLSTLTQSITNQSNGGAGGAPAGTGGNGGNISYTSTAGTVSISNTLNVTGAAGGSTNGSGGNGGNVTISGLAYFGQGGADMNLNGGNAFGSGVRGNGGNLSITGSGSNGGITTTRTFNLSAGTGGASGGVAGNHTWSTGNTVVTTGSGANDGQSSASLSGGTFTKNGTGTFFLNRANTYVGLTTVNAGTLRTGLNDALGTNAAGTVVNSGGAVDVNGVNYTTTEALTLNGSGISNAGAMQNGTGSGTWAGTVGLNSASTIGVAGTQLTISGLLSMTTNTLTKVGSGILALSNTGNTAAGGNTITISAGTLQINAAGVIPDASNIALNGGTLRTNGAFSETMGTLNVTSQALPLHLVVLVPTRLPLPTAMP
jgi:hypothetical protein